MQQILLKAGIGHDFTTIYLLLSKHKTLETEISGHEPTREKPKYALILLGNRNMKAGGDSLDGFEEKKTSKSLSLPDGALGYIFIACGKSFKNDRSLSRHEIMHGGHFFSCE